MRLGTAVLACLIAVGLTSCSQQKKDAAERDAGRAAYHASQGAKKALKEIGHELHQAGQQAHQGWTEASRDAKAKRKD